MSFDDKVKSDEAYRYDWLQVNTVIPKKPSQHLDASHYSQQQVWYITSKNANIDHHLKVMLLTLILFNLYSLLPC